MASSVSIWAERAAVRPDTTARTTAVSRTAGAVQSPTNLARPSLATCSSAGTECRINRFEVRGDGRVGGDPAPSPRQRLQHSTWVNTDGRILCDRGKRSLQIFGPTGEFQTQSGMDVSAAGHLHRRGSGLCRRAGVAPGHEVVRRGPIEHEEPARNERSSTGWKCPLRWGGADAASRETSWAPWHRVDDRAPYKGGEADRTIA